MALPEATTPPPPELDTDACVRVAAAVLLRAARDALSGDGEARLWLLAGPGRDWSSLVGYRTAPVLDGLRPEDLRGRW